MSAWSSEQGLVLAQQKVDSKSNEITAVPVLLKLLNLKGTVVTLDAMGTQTEMAAQIQQAGGDYVLALKGSQGKLSQQVEQWFEQAHKERLALGLSIATMKRWSQVITGLRLVRSGLCR